MEYSLMIGMVIYDPELPNDAQIIPEKVTTVGPFLEERTQWLERVIESERRFLEQEDSLILVYKRMRSGNQSLFKNSIGQQIYFDVTIIFGVYLKYWLFEGNNVASFFGSSIRRGLRYLPPLDDFILSEDKEISTPHFRCAYLPGPGR